MKTPTDYGTCRLTPRATAQVQLEWNMVEPPAAPPARFLDFPRRDRETPPPPRELRTEKRPLAA